MKHVTLFFTLVFSIFSSFFIAEAQKPRGQTAPKQEPGVKQTKLGIAQTMSPQQASEMLRKLYYQEELNPFLSPYAWPDYTLSPDNCFGFVLSNGSHLLGISERRDSLKLFDNDGKFLGVNIGLLYSGSAFHIGDKLLEKGAYFVYVGHDKLTIAGGQKGKTDSQSLDLSLKLDDVLIKGSGPKPRLSITQEGDKILLIIEGNKFTIKFKE